MASGAASTAADAHKSVAADPAKLTFKAQSVGCEKVSMPAPAAPVAPRAAKPAVKETTNEGLFHELNPRTASAVAQAIYLFCFLSLTSSLFAGIGFLIHVHNDFPNYNLGLLICWVVGWMILMTAYILIIMRHLPCWASRVAGQGASA